ncbi:hypothetical protein TL16_g00248 [Triparma laevis f. inornata]|uniref:Uncharacterized protein n=1 Tax=Triparma laevis f. inornata TaxID=1714386 RepID=A0A9W7DRN0_9STRA|nr:hypothetical protein TL16_g00248 [Triparma laevis f. inornata]
MLPLYSDLDDPSAKRRRPKKRNYVPLIVGSVVVIVVFVVFLCMSTTPTATHRRQGSPSARKSQQQIQKQIHESTFPKVPIPPKLQSVINSPVRSFEYGSRKVHRSSELKIISDYINKGRDEVKEKKVTVQPSIRIEKTLKPIPPPINSHNNTKITIKTQLPYLQSINTNPTPCSNPIELSSLTLLSHTTLDRVWMLTHLCERWKEEVTIVLYTGGVEEWEEELGEGLCDNLSVIGENEIWGVGDLKVL